MSNPPHLHLAAVKQILLYILGTPTRSLFFSIDFSMTLTTYSDANWASCLNTRRSTTGCYVYLGQALISWKCKKQDKVFKSSTKSEYSTMSSACLKIPWLRGLLFKLGFLQNQRAPLLADDTSVIRITKNHVFNERTEHIEVNCQFI